MMHRSYEDITGVMGPPKWWDGNGTPRYCDFSPGHCGVYDTAVGLVEIACQLCGARFNVAFEYQRHSFWLGKHESYQRPDPETLHWGDPPWHGRECHAGATMNCDDLRVIEWWEKNNHFDWVRVPEMEVKIGDLTVPD